MNVGWIGLGKLGLPCALALAHAGHEVYGFDTSLHVEYVLDGTIQPPAEDGIGDVLPGERLHLLDSTTAVVEKADVVFVAVPTPHAPEYGGHAPRPEQLRDFDYTALAEACGKVCEAANGLQKPVTLVVVSTALPGTCDRVIRPMLGEFVTLVYNPFFIAMGTTIHDFHNPEFVLLGVDSDEDAEPVRELYRTIHDRPFQTMRIPSAELTKVSYNTFISMKIVFANMLMELCHKTAADVDEVTGALAKATDRVISPKYLRGGMGDGGACHPRDLIAMSWLAARADLSFDLLGQMADAREAQSEWLASVVADHCLLSGLPLVVLGQAYKPGSGLTDGSPAALLVAHLRDLGVRPAMWWDPFVEQQRHHGLSSAIAAWRAVYVVATAHEPFFTLPFPDGSVVVDPWGRVPDQPGVTVIRVGRKG